MFDPYAGEFRWMVALLALGTDIFTRSLCFFSLPAVLIKTVLYQVVLRCSAADQLRVLLICGMCLYQVNLGLKENLKPEVHF